MPVLNSLSGVDIGSVITTVTVPIVGLIAIVYLVLNYPTIRQNMILYSHRHELPPGPKTVKTGIRKPWLWFQELSRQYGDIVYIQLGPVPTIILGSYQVAWDLLEKQGSVFSSRPRFIMGNELLSGNMRGLMAPYDNFWRRWRKLLHGGFMQRQSESYRPIQSLESKVLMSELLENPEKFRTHLARYAASVIVTVTYGRRVEDVDNDIVVKRNDEAMTRLTLVNIPGKYAVERYPALKYVPSFLAPWKAEVIKQRNQDIKLYMQLLNEVKSKVQNGTARPCFTTHLLKEQEKLGMSDLEIAYTAGSPFGAGVETSAGSLASFVLACVKFGKDFIPQAQEELDRVVGPDRLPTYDDMDNLHLIRAIVSETLRWRPVAVLGGTPHASTADFTYKGMFIPKGSTILAPFWTLHLNEKDFPDPHRFKPTRFIKDGVYYPGDYGYTNFGWGRRICPGMHLGSASIFINVARILWGFYVGPAKTERGEDIDVDIFAYTEGFNSLPMPFPATIRPRSARHAEVIRSEYKLAMEELQAYATDMNYVS